jgi:transposase InsO family protein
VVLNTYFRRVVGWSIDASPTAALLTNALGMAIDSCTPPSGAVIHSDRGVQFGAGAFTDRGKLPACCRRWAASPPASTNAMIESFWSRMQVELLNHQRWNARIELADAMFEYLEIWHDRHRRHSALSWLSPVEFETPTKSEVLSPGIRAPLKAAVDAARQDCSGLSGASSAAPRGRLPPRGT